MIKILHRAKHLFLVIRDLFISFETQARRAGVKIGINNWINSKFWIYGEPYLIRIGNNNQITSGVKIFTHGGGHVLRSKYPNFNTHGKVEIGDWCYIGNNALIMPGVKIGSHVLIAAGSVCTKSVPDNVVIGGNPARIICTLEDYESKNLVFNTNTKGIEGKQKLNIILNLPDSMFIKKAYLEN